MKSKVLNPVMRARIVQRGMWNIGNVPLVVMKWTLDDLKEKPEIKSIPMWAYLKNVPMNMYSWRGLSFIVSAAGFPVRLHPETASCSNFKLAKVKILTPSRFPNLLEVDEKGDVINVVETEEILSVVEEILEEGVDTERVIEENKEKEKEDIDTERKENDCEMQKEGNKFEENQNQGIAGIQISQENWPDLASASKIRPSLPRRSKTLHRAVQVPESFGMNGELAGFFQSKRGLRQGCALSPYLFVICINVLSGMLDKAVERKQIGWYERSIEGVLRIFKEFESCSGLRISLEKSTLYTAGISDSIKEDILASFPFSTGSLPVRYLGLPLLTKRMTVNDYLPLVEKVRKKMSSWRGRLLSHAGRLQLIKSVITSLANFWMAAFRLPSSCLKEIERLCSAYLWSGLDLKTTKAKVSWQDICYPKEEGGLGLRPLKRRHGEKPRNIDCLTKLVDKYMRLKLLSLKGRRDYYEDGLITWFGAQPNS
ncbi:hypothetical protein Bca4012_093436 [Brassica carinata]